MMTRLLCILAMMTSFSSCTIDERVIPLIGVYRAHVLGITGPFDLIISSHRGDNLLIEAPFDGDNWEIIEIDVDNKNYDVVDIDIFKQELNTYLTIHGDGFYSNGTLELKYCIRQGGNCTDYTIVATKR
ncbi:MAG: hypothetical protein WAT79_14125 [Saprospiraceae bacterium]